MLNEMKSSSAGDENSNPIQNPPTPEESSSKNLNQALPANQNQAKPSNDLTDKTSKTRTIIAILLLLFGFTYIIGVLFMWFGTKWPKWVKLILTIPVIFIILGLILVIYSYSEIDKLTSTAGQISTTPEPTPTPDPTANWNIYSGEGFTFKYPEDWEIMDEYRIAKSIESEKTATGDYTPGVMEINILEQGLVNKPINEALNDTYLSQLSDKTINTKVGYYDAIRVEGYGGVAGSVYNIGYAISKDPNTSLVLSAGTQDTDLHTILDQELNQILSSFKFTDTSEARNVETSDWKTYSNDEFGYSIKYPNDMNTNCEANSNDCSFDRFVGPGRGPENFIWFTAIPSDPNERTGSYYNGSEIDALLNAKTSESINTNPKVPNVAKYFTLNRLDDLTLDGMKVKVFQNTSPWESKSGTIERRIIFSKNNYIYTFGSYTESSDIPLSLFNQILTTFQFTQ
jgi:hypothetical protein